MKQNQTSFKVPVFLSMLFIALLLCEGGFAAPTTINDNGIHPFSGTLTDVIEVKGGSPILIFDGVTITGTNAPALSIAPGANVTLELKGANVLNGGSGCAAISVEADYDGPPDWNYLSGTSAKLTIVGSGSLTATGGDGIHNEYGSGAGIGGNGQNFDGDHGGVDFGSITIAMDVSGSVTAVGGKTPSGSGQSYGEGAGIGAGGASATTFNWDTVVGSITIQSGTVNASANGSGAGIGGCHGYGGDTLASFINIHISGGTIIAKGGPRGAGIGGGDNCDGGIIEITGGTITAVGGGGDDSEGAAGIGGGGNGSVASIDISGGTVSATASGGAAGIGGGTNTNWGRIYDTLGAAGRISISEGDTKVTANGGSKVGGSGTYGGAGIGSGYPTGNNNAFVGFNISITKGAAVYAHGGYHSQAIGYGHRPTTGSAYYTGVGITLAMDDSITLWASNEDHFLPALVFSDGSGSPPIDYASGDTYLVRYTDLSLNGTSTSITSDSDHTTGKLNAQLPSEESASWNFAGGKLSITLLGDTKDFQTDNSLIVGNWATLMKFDPLVPGDGGTPTPPPDGVLADDTPLADASMPPILPVPKTGDDFPLEWLLMAFCALMAGGIVLLRKTPGSKMK